MRQECTDSGFLILYSYMQHKALQRIHRCVIALKNSIYFGTILVTCSILHFFVYFVVTRNLKRISPFHQHEEESDRTEQSLLAPSHLPSLSLLFFAPPHPFTYHL